MIPGGGAKVSFFSCGDPRRAMRHESTVDRSGLGDSNLGPLERGWDASGSGLILGAEEPHPRVDLRPVVAFEPGADTIAVGPGQAWSPDARLCIGSGRRDCGDHGSQGRVALREIKGGWDSPRFLDDLRRAHGVAFSPDGRFLALGGIEPGLQSSTGCPAKRDDCKTRPCTGPRRWPSHPTAAPSRRRPAGMETSSCGTSPATECPRPSTATPRRCVSRSRPTAGPSPRENETSNVSSSGISKPAATGYCSKGPRPDLLGRVLARRKLAGRCQSRRAHGPDLEREDRSIVPSARGTYRRHHLGQFLPGWSHSGHRGQRRDGPILVGCQRRAGNSPRWPVHVVAPSGLLRRWPNARRVRP